MLFSTVHSARPIRSSRLELRRFEIAGALASIEGCTKICVKSVNNMHRVLYSLLITSAQPRRCLLFGHRPLDLYAMSRGSCYVFSLQHSGTIPQLDPPEIWWWITSGPFEFNSSVLFNTICKMQFYMRNLRSQTVVTITLHQHAWPGYPRGTSVKNVCGSLTSHRIPFFFGSYLPLEVEWGRLVRHSS